jgi:hypothetical protein
MKINWKQLAKSNGYRVFKKSFTKYKLRTKCHADSADKTFKKIIGLAQSTAFKYCKYPDLYAYFMGRILEDWEDGRNYCWLNYYSSSKFNKLHSNSIKRKNTIKYYKSLKNTVGYKNKSITETQQKLRKDSGKKARWTKHQKEFYLKHSRK